MERTGGSERIQVRRQAGVSLGSGWLLPAGLAALFLTMDYLPAHGTAAGGIAEAMALVATLYAAGLVIASQRVLRAIVLRLAGRPLHLVLLGTTGDDLADPRIRPRIRLFAIAAGGTMAAAIGLTAMQLASTVRADSYPHAVADVAATVAMLTALAALLPVPPFLGWSLLLALLDAVGVSRATRAQHAARLSRLALLPLIAVWAIAAAVAGAWPALLLAVSVAVYSRYATRVAVGRDMLARFLEAHTVADIARPPIVRAGPDDPVPMIAFTAASARGAVFIERRDGFLVGAIGTHRLRRLRVGSLAADAPWRDLMVPVARVPWGHVSESADAILDGLHRWGIVLVPVGNEIHAIEEDDLFDQAAAWVGAVDDAGRIDGAASGSPSDADAA